MTQRQNCATRRCPRTLPLVPEIPPWARHRSPRQRRGGAGLVGGGRSRGRGRRHRAPGLRRPPAGLRRRLPSGHKPGQPRPTAVAMRELHARLRVEGLSDAEAAALPVHLRSPLSLACASPRGGRMPAASTSWPRSPPAKAGTLLRGVGGRSGGARSRRDCRGGLLDDVTGKERADRPKDRIALEELPTLRRPGRGRRVGERGPSAGLPRRRVEKAGAALAGFLIHGARGTDTGCQGFPCGGLSPALPASPS